MHCLPIAPSHCKGRVPSGTPPQCSSKVDVPSVLLNTSLRPPRPHRISGIRTWGRYAQYATRQLLLKWKMTVYCNMDNTDTCFLRIESIHRFVQESLRSRPGGKLYFSLRRNVSQSRPSAKPLPVKAEQATICHGRSRRLVRSRPSDI